MPVNLGFSESINILWKNYFGISRYLVLDHLPQERASIVVDYLEEIHKRGPPPPPTASDASRRK